MIKNSFVLDACALIAYLRTENGSDIVTNCFENALEKKCSIYIHKATIAEVYYDTLRVSDINEAESMLKDLSLLPILISSNLTNSFIQKIGYFKVNHKISFADSFVLALASIKKAKVISSDHHEFDEIEKTKILSFLWIR